MSRVPSIATRGSGCCACSTAAPISGADTAVIRGLAGKADIRTTAIDTAVSDARLERTIEARSLQRHGVRRAAARRRQ